MHKNNKTMTKKARKPYEKLSTLF